LDQLQEGDVILTRSSGQLVSTTICCVTLSRYSHAMLVLQPPYCIESSDYGVVKFSLRCFAVRDTDNILVRQVPGLSASTRAQVTAYASSKVTSEYADKDVWTAPIPPIPRSEIGKYFCSQLIAEAYASASIRLTDQLPEKTTPGALAKSTVMVDVDMVGLLSFRAAGSADFLPALLDGPNSQSPTESESVLKQFVCRRIAKPFADCGVIVTTYHAALEALLKFWRVGSPKTMALDKAFATAIHASGILADPHRQYPPDSEAFFIDMLMRNALVLGQFSQEQLLQLLEFYKAELTTIANTNSERDIDVTALKHVYPESGLETIRLHLALTWDALLTASA